VIPVPLASCQTLWNHEFLRIEVFEFLRKSQSSLKFSSFIDLLGKISWGYVRRLVAEVSSKFHWIWTSFARDSSFEILFTGFSGWHRSDRSRPVQATTGQTGPLHRSDRSRQSSSAICIVLTLLLPRSFLGLFARR